MNTHKLSNAISGILRDIFSPENQMTEANQETAYLFQRIANGWKLTASEKVRLDEAVEILRRKYNKVHARTCRKYLEGFCCEQFPGNYACFQAKLPELFNELDQANQNKSDVFVEIAGLQLQMERFRLGSIEFLHSDDPMIDELRKSVPDINGNYADPLPGKCVVARCCVEGDSEYSREVAVERIQLALDILQFASAPLNSSLLKQSILGFGLYLGENQTPASLKTWTYQQNKPSWHSYSGQAKRPNNHLGKFGLQLNKENLEKMQQCKLPELGEILSRFGRSHFEENILSAIRWFAKAVRDVELEDKYLNLFIALEGLLSNDVSNSENSPKAAFTHREGVAFLLGQDTESRMHFHEKFGELAKTRNKIVHSGYSLIDETELLDLFNYVLLCCFKALELKDNFKEAGSFSKWAKRVKFGEPIDVILESNEN